LGNDLGIDLQQTVFGKKFLNWVYVQKFFEKYSGNGLLENVL
jgi:hypothetical protein